MIKSKKMRETLSKVFCFMCADYLISKMVVRQLAMLTSGSQ